MRNLKSYVLGSVLSAAMLMPLSLNASDSSEANKLFGKSDKGRLPADVLDSLETAAKKARSDIQGEVYERVVYHPETARGVDATLASLSARQVIALGFANASMSTKTRDPKGNEPKKKSTWTRWKSLRRAIEGLTEVSVALDDTAALDFMLVNEPGNEDYVSFKELFEVESYFRTHEPEERVDQIQMLPALEKLYTDKVQGLLTSKEPVTVVVFFDKVPEDLTLVKSFFERIKNEQLLDYPDNQALISFNFIQIGEDQFANDFRKYLDKEYKQDGDERLDLVRTAEDECLFEDGEDHRTFTFHRKKDVPVGPFAVLWNSLFKF